MPGAQIITGGVLSTTVTVWLHVAVLLQQSVACQVAVITCEHGPAGVPSGFTLVAVLTSVIVTFVQPQGSLTVGGSNVQFEPHSTVLFVAQTISGTLHLPAAPAL